MEDSKIITEDSFVSHIVEYRYSLLRLCNFYADGHLSVEDLYQDIILETWKSYRSFNGKSSIKTWLFRIALNVCMRGKNKIHREKKALKGLEIIRVPERGHVEQLEKREMLKTLCSLIRDFNEPDRTIVLLYLDSFPYKDIAEITGLSENNISVRMFRIKKSLALSFKEDPDGE
jgi:RNA polymerase sigma factor (sigma-70 family)